jgi:hypothetical protein
MGFVVVSFYTEKTPYADEVKKLAASAERFGLNCWIKGAPNLGSWEKNCQYKAVFIREALDQFSDDVVWVDADAVFEQIPTLFDELTCDIAYHYLEYRKELLSGTLFIKNNEKMRASLDQWIALNKTNNEWDQKNLQQIVEQDNTLQCDILPEAYCKIHKHKVQVERNPVITHYQASRRYRRAINSGRYR